MRKEILDHLLELRAAGMPFAVATVVETHGSASAKAGAKAIIDAEGRVVSGWVGGGCAESTVCEEGRMCIESGDTSMIDIDLDDEMLGAGMPCGGGMRVFIEPHLPRPTLWIMGHGRVTECLCSIGDMMGLRIIVNDPGLEPDKYPGASALITDDLDYEQLQPKADDYVVVATQHKGDHESMIRALKSPARYIALIASRKRATLIMKYLGKKGFTAQQLENVMAPCGLDLGAKTPEEIALCVISEIVLVRRGGSGLRLRDKFDSTAFPEEPSDKLKREAKAPICGV